MPDISSSYDNFSLQFERICEATGCRTQVELAALLGIKQSSVSIVKKQGRIPKSWLVTLYALGINPEWIMSGKGQKLIATSSMKEQNVSGNRPPDKAVLRNILYCIPLADLLEELHRRKASIPGDDEG